jgi:hypothetical protein
MAILNEIQSQFDNGMEYTGVILNQTTAFTLKSISGNWGESGVLMVWCAGVDTAGNGVTGCKVARYRKSDAGVLTIGSVQSVLAVQRDTGMNGCDFNLVANNNQIEVTVVGTATPKEIAWRIVINPTISVSFAMFP